MKNKTIKTDVTINENGDIIVKIPGKFYPKEKIEKEKKPNWLKKTAVKISKKFKREKKTFEISAVADDIVEINEVAKIPEGPEVSGPVKRVKRKDKDGSKRRNKEM